MKTTWSLALLAGSAIASPSWEQWSSEGSWESSTSEVASSSSATVSSAVASSTTSSSASVESSSSAASTSAAVSSSVSKTESSSAVVSSTPSSSAVLTTSSSVSSSTGSAVLSSSTSSEASSSSASSLSSVSSWSHSIWSTGSASSSSSAVSSSSVASSSPVQSSSSALSSAVLSSSSVYSSGKVSSSSAASTASSSASTQSAVLSSSSAKSSSAASSALSSSAAHSTGTHKKHHHHTAYSSGSAVTKSSPASPVSSAATSTQETTTFVTKVTTVYTTTYPVASSYTSTVSAATWGGSSSVESGIWTSLTTSTVTSVYYSTVTEAVTCPAVTETSVTTYYTTVYPSGVSPVSTAQTTSTSTLTSTLTLSPEVSVAGVSTVYVSPVPLVSSQSAGKSAASTTVTQITATYTTVYPTTTTVVSAGSTLTSVKTVTSTVSGVFLSSITYNGESSAALSSTEFPVSTVTFGSTTLTYTVTAPITFPTVTPSKHHTWGPWVVSSQSEGSAAASGSVGVSGSIVKSGSAAASSPAAAVSSSAAGSSSAATSKTGKPVVTGSSSKAVYGSASAVVSSARVSGTARASGTAAVSVIRPSSATSSAPVSTPSTCVRCEGQPGTDQFCGYTAADNWYKVTPKTCRTVYYDWTITNTTFAPDGVSRIGLLINGQFPGPLIEASWGDTIVLNLKNELTDNGTSIHFHGQRQLRNNEMDGVPSITQCPLAPGESMTYTFTAENYGSSWYHSHFSLQIQDGVQGPMLIHGPLQDGVTYDDEEFFVLTDWNHVSLNELYDTSQDVSNPHSGPPVLDTGLINGLNVWNDSGVEVGSRFKMTVTQGKSYRIRLVNTGAQSSFKFYVDQHNFTVIAADYVPIVPYVTNIVNLNCGQRYDIVLKADQPVANYWARSDGQNVCMVLKNNLDIKAIIHYEGADDELPTSTAWPYTPKCEDEPMASLVPVVALNAGNQDQTVTENVLIGGNNGQPNLFKWTLSGTTFTSEWDSPTLIGITNNGSVPDWSGSLDIETKGLGEWIYIIIESPIPVPHPIHLHGHDFFVLAQGYGHYDSSIPLQTTNPPRRDTAMMPSYQGTAGYLVIAYETDNPGAWLLHCHIIWHAAMGLALQIIEGLDEIKDTVKYADNNNQVCADWHAWDVATNWDITATDSGI